MRQRSTQRTRYVQIGGRHCELRRNRMSEGRWLHQGRVAMRDGRPLGRYLLVAAVMRGGHVHAAALLMHLYAARALG